MSCDGELIKQALGDCAPAVFELLGGSAVVGVSGGHWRRAHLCLVLNEKRNLFV